MTESLPAAASAFAPTADAPWTCPFCPLLCDGFGVEAAAGTGALQLVGSDCPRARAALARFDGRPGTAASARVAGRRCEVSQAIDEAARLLGASRLPLFGGLGTDVAGARALHALACRLGAIGDAAAGPELMAGLRVLQDRGGYTTTFAEIRTRADLIVCIGGVPTERYPEFFHRCGVSPGSNAGAHVVVMRSGADSGSPASLAAAAGRRAEYVDLPGDVFECVALLAASVAAPGLPLDVPPAIAALAAGLRNASYAVIVYDTAGLAGHGALAIEAIHRIVDALNRSTRAAAFPLGGSDGAASVNQVFGWLSGLPLRSRAGPVGLEHEPVCFDAARLLADGAVDSLLWVASFGTEPPPPASTVPRIVLGHPAFAADPAFSDVAVFIPVSTPGIGSAGHLFRTDATVLMPLVPVAPDGLPSVAEVARRLTQALRRPPGEPARMDA